MQAYNDPVVVTDFCETGEGGYLIRKSHVPAFDESARKEIQARGPVVFIQRDPRDVAVSAMYYRALEPTDENLMHTLASMVDRQAPSQHTNGIYSGAGIYEAWIRSWANGPGKPAFHARYERLHLHPIEELQAMCEAVAGVRFDEGHIRAAYERQRFEVWKPEYPHSMRKGVVGDWRNHFKRRHGRYFAEHLNDLMLEQGYIHSRAWWQELPE